MTLTSRPYCRAKERAAKRYSTDLSDQEWEIICPLMPPPKVRGSKRKVEFREVLNAIFYQIHNGCIWSDLPKDLPAHQTVYKYFQKWQRKGVWQQIHDALRREVRESVGKLPDASAGSIDSQTVKTTEKSDYLECQACYAITQSIGISLQTRIQHNDPTLIIVRVLLKQIESQNVKNSSTVNFPQWLK